MRRQTENRNLSKRNASSLLYTAVKKTTNETVQGKMCNNSKDYNTLYDKRSDEQSARLSRETAHNRSSLCGVHSNAAAMRVRWKIKTFVFLRDGTMLQPITMKEPVWVWLHFSISRRNLKLHLNHLQQVIKHLHGILKKRCMESRCVFFPR